MHFCAKGAEILVSLCQINHSPWKPLGRCCPAAPESHRPPDPAWNPLARPGSPDLSVFALALQAPDPARRPEILLARPELPPYAPVTLELASATSRRLRSSERSHNFSRPIGGYRIADRSAVICRLIRKTTSDHSPSGRRVVRDRAASGRRPLTDRNQTGRRSQLVGDRSGGIANRS